MLLGWDLCSITTRLADTILDMVNRELWKELRDFQEDLEEGKYWYWQDPNNQLLRLALQLLYDIYRHEQNADYN